MLDVKKLQHVRIHAVELTNVEPNLEDSHMVLALIKVQGVPKHLLSVLFMYVLVQNIVMILVQRRVVVDVKLIIRVAHLVDVMIPYHILIGLMEAMQQDGQEAHTIS